MTTENNKKSDETVNNHVIYIVDNTKSKSVFSKYVLPGLCIVGALAAGVIIGSRCSQLIEDSISKYV